MTPHLHRRFPELAGSLKHLPLASGPTPVRRLAGLEHDGGAEIWLKDDGAFGDGGWGGNKVRKLEWLIPDAQRRGARTILTFGGLGTNWGLATALYAREQGLRTALGLVDQPVDAHVEAQLERLRNSGARLHFTHTKPRTVAQLPLLVARYTSGRHLPYVLPAGGSSAVGTLGYVEASFELAEQVRTGALPEPSHVVVAVGSGGTIAGLHLGLRLAGLRSRAIGVVVNDTLKLDGSTLTRLARRAQAVLARRGADVSSVVLADDALAVPRDWIGPGYGHPTDESENARALAAEHAGLQLDPVYTAKAMAGLLAMEKSGRLSPGPIVFVHTDGPRA